MLTLTVDKMNLKNQIRLGTARESWSPKHANVQDYSWDLLHVRQPQCCPSICLLSVLRFALPWNTVSHLQNTQQWSVCWLQHKLRWDERKHWVETNSFVRDKKGLKDAISFIQSFSIYREKPRGGTPTPPLPPCPWHKPPGRHNLLLLDPGLLLIYPSDGTPASPAACLCLHWGRGITEWRKGYEDVCLFLCDTEMGGWEYVDGGDADSTDHIGETNKEKQSKDQSNMVS